MLSIKLKDPDKTKLVIAESGYTLRGFAETADLSHSYLSQILSGKRNPSPKVALKIAKALRVKMNDIFLIKTVENNNQKEEA